MNDIAHKFAKEGKVKLFYGILCEVGKISKIGKIKYMLCFLCFFSMVILCIVFTSVGGFNIKSVNVEILLASFNDQSGIKQVEKEDKIDINTAVLSELMCLEQIGEKRAQDIINYRNEQGGFKNIDELMNISGISENIFEKIKDYVTIS